MIARKLLLAASTNPFLRDHATKTAFVRRSVSAFMPGERLEDALDAATSLRTEGITTILTKLGENITGADEAAAVTEHYLDALDRVAAAGLDAQISVKPTQLGFDFDAKLCSENLMRLVQRAEATRNFVWIDMESSPYVDPTIALFKQARERTTRVGVALQAYLYRTAQDVEALAQIGSAIRLVKGAYLEPPDIAFPKKADVDENYYALACRLLGDGARKEGSLLHIATHDARLAGRISAFAESHRVPQSAYEHAMLYGIQRPLQRQLRQAGRPVRVLISYGEYWFPWYMRRLAERPANVLFVVRNVFAR